MKEFTYSVKNKLYKSDKLVQSTDVPNWCRRKFWPNEYTIATKTFIRANYILIFAPCIATIAISFPHDILSDQCCGFEYFKK